MDEGLLLSFERFEREHWWFVVRRRIVLDAVAACAPTECAHILEVGCGTGGLLRELRRVIPHAQLSGVEPSTGAAAVARRFGCTVHEAVFENLPAEQESVDLLLALDVLEHCPDDRIAAAEAYRVLRPGGLFIATVPALPALWGPHDEINEHQRRYMRTTLRRPLEQAGLVIDRVTYFNTLLLPIGYAGRALARLTRSTRGTGVELPSRALNVTLRGIFGLEVPMLRHVNLPVGMSLLCIARKPTE